MLRNRVFIQIHWEKKNTVQVDIMCVELLLFEVCAWAQEDVGDIVLIKKKKTFGIVPRSQYTYIYIYI